MSTSSCSSFQLQIPKEYNNFDYKAQELETRCEMRLAVEEGHEYSA